MNDTLDLIDDSALDNVAGGLGLTLGLEGNLVNGSVSASVSKTGISAGVSLSVFGIKLPSLSLGVSASVG